MEHAVFHILIQSASGLGVERPDKQQVRLDCINQVRGGIGVLLPHVRAAAAEDRVEGVIHAGLCQPQQLFARLPGGVAFVHIGESRIQPALRPDVQSVDAAGPELPELRVGFCADILDGGVHRDRFHLRQFPVDRVRDGEQAVR